MSSHIIRFDLPGLIFDVEFTQSSVPPEHAVVLYETACEAGKLELPGVEIGSYIGTSTIFLAAGLKMNGQKLVAIDHHSGSAEHLEGRFSDPDYIVNGRHNTFEKFLDHTSPLKDSIIPIVADSKEVVKIWNKMISILFIDGSHDEEAVLQDYQDWSRFIVPGGFLIFHDCALDEVKEKMWGVYPGPGAVARKVVSSGSWEIVKTIATTMLVLKKL